MTITKFDLRLEFSGGFPAPTVDECTAHTLCRAKLDAVGEPSLEYVAATDAITADGTLATTLAPFLRGRGLTVDSSGNLGTRIRPRKAQICERFLSGGLTSGTIGNLGWNLLGSGTPAFWRLSITGAGATNRVELATSSVANDRAVLSLGDTESRAVLALSEMELLQFTSQFNSVLTNKRIFFGLTSDASSAPQAMPEGLGIFYDSGINGNWQLISRAASVGAAVDSMVAVSAASAQLLTIWQASANVFQCYVGSSLLGQLTTNLSTAGLNLVMRLETITGAAKQHRLGLVNIDANWNGAMDDDGFLDV